MLDGKYSRSSESVGLYAVHSIQLHAAEGTDRVGKEDWIRV